MADVGVVLVGSELAEWSDGDVPVRRVSGSPPRAAGRAAVTAAATSVYSGADADRWASVPDAQLQRHTHMLWVAQAVQTHVFDAWGTTVEHALVVGWVDDPALVPAVRQVLRSGVPCGVLLLGDSTHRDVSRVHATHTVLGQLLRDQQVLQVWTVSERLPSLSVWVPIGISLLRNASPPRVPSPVELDPGPWLGLEPMPSYGASAIEFQGLEQIPLGRTAGLDRAARLVAAHAVLLQLCEAEPGFRPIAPTPDEPPPPMAVADDVGDAVREALGAVRFRGTEPLVEQIERLLRPVALEVERAGEAITTAERARLSGLEAFTAYGIFRTVDGLREALAGIDQMYPAEHLRGIALLLDGTPDAMDDAHDVPLHAWRRAFAGVSSEVFPSTAAGAGLARRLVRERFSQFRTAFAAQLSAHLHALLTRAHDPDAPASSVELGLVLRRAERVRDAVTLVSQNLLDRARTESEAAIRSDVLVRSLTRDPAALVEALKTVLTGASELRARFTDVLQGFRDGPVDAQTFETELQGLVEALHDVPEQGAVGTYGEVVGRLVGDVDPQRLRTAVAPGSSGEVHVGRDLAGADDLLQWLGAAGLSRRDVDSAQSTVVVFRPLPGRRGPAVGRRSTTEHRLDDLLLPDPSGDSVAALIALARAIAVIVTAIAADHVQVTPIGSGRAWRLDGTGLDDSVPPILPVDGVARLAARDDARENLERAVGQTLQRLTEQAANRVVASVMGLSRRGIPPLMRAQLGLDGRYARVLDTLVPPLLSRLVEPTASRLRAVAAPGAQDERWTDLSAPPGRMRH